MLVTEIWNSLSSGGKYIGQIDQSLINKIDTTTSQTTLYLDNSNNQFDIGSCFNRVVDTQIECYIVTEVRNSILDNLNIAVAIKVDVPNFELSTNSSYPNYPVKTLNPYLKFQEENAWWLTK